MSGEDPAAAEVRAQRAENLEVAYAANPARFRHRRPEPPKLPTIAWINEPGTAEGPTGPWTSVHPLDPIPPLPSSATLTSPDYEDPIVWTA